MARNNNSPPFARHTPAEIPAQEPTKLVVQLSRTHQRIRGGIHFARGRTKLMLSGLTAEQIREIVEDDVLVHRFE